MENPAPPRRSRPPSSRRDWGSWLLSFYHDNLVYRHEIGMSVYGRLRPGSPVVRAHLTMLALMIGMGLFLLGMGWWGLFAAAGSALLGITAATHVLAFRAGYRSIQRERTGGTLEQILLTALTHREFFEGKYYGALAPYYEARRYLVALGAMTVFAVSQIAPYGIWPWVITPCLIAINHYVYSAQMGVQGGLRAAALRKPMLMALIGDLNHNPLAAHARALIRHLLFVAIPVALVLMMAGISQSPLTSAMAAFLTIYLPVASAHDLRDREYREREVLGNRFKQLFTQDEDWARKRA